MEAPEVPLESVQEHMHEHAQHAAHENGRKWVMGVALTAALFAALAAVAALLAGDHANEAMIEQMKASDQWAYYQAKGIKGNVLESKLELLTALGKEVSPKDEEKVKQYKEEQEKVSEEANAHQEKSEAHLRRHVTLAHAVTMFQVAIAVAAIAVLTNRRLFWYVSIAFGLVGVFYQIKEILMK